MQQKNKCIRKNELIFTLAQRKRIVVCQGIYLKEKHIHKHYSFNEQLSNKNIYKATLYTKQTSYETIWFYLKSNITSAF